MTTERVSRGGDLERASFAGSRVLVLGLGRFAGGVETVRFLRAEGADVRVSDRATREALAGPAAEAEALGARLTFGAQEPALLDGCDVVLAGPAIPFDHPVLAAARARGVPATTEINIVLARSPAPVLAVTGTKGKSTTSTLLARMLEANGHTVHLGGNIGRPLVATLDAIAATDRVVLELSSFQLWWTRAVRISPQTTVVTNLLSDHLDRHGTQAHYADSKRAALDYQGTDDVAVLPADDAAIRAEGWHEAGRARRVTFGAGGRFHLEGTVVRDADHSDVAVDLAGSALLGAHNRRNALAAAAAVLHEAPSSASAVAAGVRATKPLPHRLDPVGEVDGVLYLDDSNATHPDSTCCALEAMDRPTVLIAGGKDKGADPRALFETIRRRAKAAVAIGSTAPVLLDALAGDLPLKAATTMDDAVRMAAALAAPGDVVLLSPAFSSLDQFTSFADRGDRFRAAVRSLEDDQ